MIIDKGKIDGGEAAITATRARQTETPCPRDRAAVYGYRFLAAVSVRGYLFWLPGSGRERWLVETAVQGVGYQAGGGRGEAARVGQEVPVAVQGGAGDRDLGEFAGG